MSFVLLQNALSAWVKLKMAVQFESKGNKYRSRVQGFPCVQCSTLARSIVSCHFHEHQNNSGSASVLGTLYKCIWFFNLKIPWNCQMHLTVPKIKLCDGKKLKKKWRTLRRRVGEWVQYLEQEWRLSSTELENKMVLFRTTISEKINGQWYCFLLFSLLNRKETLHSLFCTLQENVWCVLAP